jgi:hypothetical protein
MEKRFIVVLLVMVGLIGCAAPRQYSQPSQPAYKPQQAGPVALPSGFVPIDIPNPLLLEQECLAFWGSELVNIVPDPRGGWMYNRKAMPYVFIYRDYLEAKRRGWYMVTQPFTISAANSENNWWSYTTIAGPRSSNFIMVAQALNFWGRGEPNMVYFSTGSAPVGPGSTTYTRTDPYRRQFTVGGLVPPLYSRPVAPFGNGSGPTNIYFTIDLSGVGHGITNSLMGR